MKQILLSMTLAAIALSSQAQVLKSDILKNYKEGDALDKGVYTDKKEPIKENTWCGAFATNPVEGAEGPTIGKPMTYEGYAEGGPSINFGGYPEGMKAARVSVYSMTSGKAYATGTYYLACVVNFSKLGSGGFADFLALTPSYVGGSNRGQVYVAREGKDKIKFAVGLLKLRTEIPLTYDYNKPHLLVMKLDFDKNQVSLFIDPTLSAEEPKADAVVDGEEGALKASLKAISFRNRSGYQGNIGNFRFAKSWAGVIGK